MESNIKIIVIDDVNPTKYVPTIRAFTKESIMDIKNKILNKEAVITCEYIENPEELVEVYGIIKKLEEKGAVVEIKWDSKVIDKTIVRNLIESDRVISRQVEEDMEREYYSENYGIEITDED